MLCFWQVISDPSLAFKQRSLVIDAARALDKAKMMRFDEKSGNFYCTELGRIASHYYIQYTSVETYNEMLKRHMNDSEVICFGCFLLLLLACSSLYLWPTYISIVLISVSVNYHGSPFI